MSVVKLLKEVEFLENYGGDTHIELIDGVVVRYERGGTKSAFVACNFSCNLARFVDERELGWVAINDTFVRVRTHPIRIRCADVLYLRYSRWPADAGLTDGPMPATPELIVEMKTAAISWMGIFEKVTDYLGAGTRVVLVIDTHTDSVHAFRSDTAPQVFATDAELTIPDVLPGFGVPVASLFK